MKKKRDISKSQTFEVNEKKENISGIECETGKKLTLFSHYLSNYHIQRKKSVRNQQNTCAQAKTLWQKSAMLESDVK